MARRLTSWRKDDIIICSSHYRKPHLKGVRMGQTQLSVFFEKNDIGPREISKKTGYTIRYILNLTAGYDRLTDSARFKFIQAFPETAAFLLAETTEKELVT